MTLNRFHEGLDVPTGKQKLPLSILAKRDALKLVEAFDTIKDRKLAKSIVALVAPIAELAKA